MLVVGMLGFFLIFLLGLLIAVAVIIYKDANKHDMNGKLWALLVILIPNFLGVIIYLIMRNTKEKEVYCSSCHSKVEIDYNICPMCHSIFEKICPTCKHAVDKVLEICPYCGEDVRDIKDQKTAYKISKKTNITKSLVICLGLFLGAIILFFTSFIVVTIAEQGGLSTDISVMNLEYNINNHYKASFKYKQGTKRLAFTVDPTKHSGIDADFNLTKGAVTYKVKDAQGNIISQEDITSGKDERFISLTPDEKTKYTMEIEYKKAGGSVEVQLEDLSK